MVALPTYYTDAIATGVRSGEVPLADFDGGMNNGGSNAPGIGISTDQLNLTESLPSWTLLDQDGDARVPQNSQFIGGVPLGDGTAGKGQSSILVGTNSTDGDGTVTPDGEATLSSLALGWQSV